MSLLIAGQAVEVPGVRILSPNAEPWNRLVAGYPRGTRGPKRPQMKILHKTIADDREFEIKLPAAPMTSRWGGAQDTVEYWAKAKLSGTQIVTGENGDSVCTADLADFVGWHGNYANDRSWGHEIKERVGGGYFAQAMTNAVMITAVDTYYLGVQQQIPKSYKNNTPYPRFKNGGVDLIGVFGHRDVTDSRGYWDPGDVVFDQLEHIHGFERFDFYACEDLAMWEKRQIWLRDQGYYHGTIDGIAGAGTTDALKLAGFPGGIIARFKQAWSPVKMPAALLPRGGA